MTDSYILKDKSTLCLRYCCQRAVILLSGWQTYSMIRVMSHQSRDSIIRKRRGKLMGIWAWRSGSRDNPSMRTTEEHIQALVSRRSTKIGNCTPIGVLETFNCIKSETQGGRSPPTIRKCRDCALEPLQPPLELPDVSIFLDVHMRRTVSPSHLWRMRTLAFGVCA